jgi:hypothetical protein
VGTRKAPLYDYTYVSKPLLREQWERTAPSPLPPRWRRTRTWRLGPLASLTVTRRNTVEDLQHNQYWLALQAERQLRVEMRAVATASAGDVLYVPQVELS